VPLILGSDETQITSFAGHKAYPLMLTVGNLPLRIRRQHNGREVLSFLPMVDERFSASKRKTTWYREHKRIVLWAAMASALRTLDPNVTVIAMLKNRLRTYVWSRWRRMA
jgi:hypothetical protein